MRKNLGLFGVLMVAVFLATSLIVPATASALSTADTVGTLFADQCALDIIRNELYEAYGTGMTPGGTSKITGGDRLINEIGGYAGLSLDQLADMGLAPSLTPTIMANISAGLASYDASGECPVVTDCWSFEWSLIPQICVIPSDQWQVFVDCLGQDAADGIDANKGALSLYTLYDLATGFNDSILPEIPCLNSGWAGLCVKDTDDDGVADEDDNCPTTANPDQADLDGDGIGDACDDCMDVDQDGVCGAVDNCPNTPNPDQADADGDGIGDVCDDCLDSDGDGVCDAVDNCPAVANADQADADGDGIGDACDDCMDVDQDDVCDDVDNCPTMANADQADADGDGVGDVCDDCLDSDGDSVCDAVDNCPAVANTDQADADGDGIGDACDDCIDVDQDDVCDDVDNCPTTANSDQADADGNGIGDACDGSIDVDQDGFGADVDCNDNDAAINPGAIEIPNNDVDEDCDGVAFMDVVASCYTTADTVGTLFADPCALDIIRKELYMAYGTGINTVPEGEPLGGNILINSLSGYAAMSLDDIVAFDLVPELTPEIMANITANLAIYCETEECPIVCDCPTYEWTLVPQLISDSDAWQVIVDCLGQEDADGVAAVAPALSLYTLHDLNTGYKGGELDNSCFEAGWAEICDPCSPLEDKGTKVFTDGDEDITVSISYGSLAVEAASVTMPEELAFVYSPMNITISGIDVGTTVDVTIELPAAAPAEASAFKLIDGIWKNIDSRCQYNSQRTRVTFQVTDGGWGDNDKIADGQISDPVGIAETVDIEPNVEPSDITPDGKQDCFIGSMLF